MKFKDEVQFKGKAYIFLRYAGFFNEKAWIIAEDDAVADYVNVSDLALVVPA
jgi:hypothetical protein